MIKAAIDCKCCKCGIEIKPGHAIYLCKVNVQENERVRYAWNKHTKRSELIGPDKSTRHIRMMGGTKTKHLMCLACFDKMMYQVSYWD